VGWKKKMEKKNGSWTGGSFLFFFYFLVCFVRGVREREREKKKNKSLSSLSRETYS
jgi:hypothetical protein